MNKNPRPSGGPFFVKQKHARFSRKSGTVMYVFICSAGHSGSTLLDILIGSHPQGLSLGEITLLPKNIALDSQCSCGRPISSCQFWSPIVTGFGKTAGIDFWSRPYELDFGFIKASDEIDRRHQTNARMMYRRISYGLQYLSMRYRLPGQSVFRRHSIDAAKNKADFFDYIQTQSGKSFVVDSSKHYLEAINLHSAAPADTKIVLLVRDGRAVFHSGLRRGMNPKSALASWANTCAALMRYLLTACHEGTSFPSSTRT